MTGLSMLSLLVAAFFCGVTVGSLLTGYVVDSIHTKGKP